MQATPGAAAILHEDSMEVPLLLEIHGGNVAFWSSKAPGKDGANEDAAALVPVDEGAVLAVADGLGGHPEGDRASRLALEALLRATSADGTESQDLRDGILDAFEEANRAVTALGVGAGTTLTVVEILGHAVRPYHVGDSMILITGQRGRVKLQTVSHSPVGYAVEAGLIGEDDALHHEDLHIVSNMVGSEDMRIEVGSRLELCRRDTLLLASDGLSDNLTTDEIVNLIRKGPLLEAAQSLALAATRRMTTPQPGLPSKPDDLTVLLYRAS